MNCESPPRRRDERRFRPRESVPARSTDISRVFNFSLQPRRDIYFFFIEKKKSKYLYATVRSAVLPARNVFSQLKLLSGARETPLFVARERGMRMKYFDIENILSRGLCRELQKPSEA